MKRQAIRQNIVETASTLFYKQGYNSTGINEIIAESGVAKATLYNHFSSKEELCIAYLRHKNAGFMTDIATYCHKKRKGKPQLLGLFDFLLVFFKDDDFNGCWCIKTVAEIPIDNGSIRDEIQKLKGAFIDFISELVKENTQLKNAGSIKRLARQIYLLYESAVAESHLHQDNWPIKEAKSLCTKILS